MGHASQVENGLFGSINVTRHDGKAFDANFLANTTYDLDVSLVPQDEEYRGYAAQVGGTWITLRQNDNTGGCGITANLSNSATFSPEISIDLGDRVMSRQLRLFCTAVSDKSSLTMLVADETYASTVNNFTTFRSDPGYFTFDYPKHPFNLFAKSPHALISAANLTFSAPADNNYGIEEYV